MINEDQLLRLLSGGPESERVEFTRATKDDAKFQEVICEFANDLADSRQPGYLIIGVDNSGVPTGAEISEQLLLQLAHFRSDGQIIPPPMMHVERMSVRGVPVAVVEVFPSTQPPVRYKGRTCIRVGPRRGFASVEEERRLAEKRVSRSLTWDARANEEAELNDLAVDLFRTTYLPKAVSAADLEENHRTVEEQLGALRLFDPKAKRPTNAAVLLFAHDCLYFLPGAYVQYVGYSGISQSDEVDTERRIAADLLTLMRELDHLAKRIADSRPVRQPDLADRTVFAYPPVALHELFMNAVIHRNYEGSTTPVMINQFSDRIEIHNPGALYGDLTRQEFPKGTAYRNPVIAEAAKVYGFVNRFGRGIAIAQKELERNGNPRAEFEIGENHFAVTVRAVP